MAMGKFFPRLAVRLVSPAVFSLLLITAVATFVVQALALYLRAHKDEPFVLQSVLCCNSNAFRDHAIC
jgi:hypothetical protein